MDRRTRNLFALALGRHRRVTGAAALLLGGTGRPDPSPPRDAQRWSGVIVGVDRPASTKVQGFTLRTTDQASLPFEIGDLENGAEFPPGHLVEHQSTAQPVRVWYRTEDGDQVAIRLEDAT